MGTHRNKPTDRQRKVMAAAVDGQLIGEDLLSAAQLLSARGYVNVVDQGDGLHRVEITEVMRWKNGSVPCALAKRRRYPPLRRAVTGAGDNGDSGGISAPICHHRPLRR
jgi:hypothetical protein